MSDVRKNGVLKFEENEGRLQVQFGEAPAFEIDVMAVSNEWFRVDSSFRDDNDKIPRERLPDFGEAPWRFVRDLMARAMEKMDQVNKAKMVAAADRITLAVAQRFLHKITEETKRLRSFFEESSPAPLSSPESSKSEVVYRE